MSKQMWLPGFDLEGSLVMAASFTEAVVANEPASPAAETTPALPSTSPVVGEQGMDEDTESFADQFTPVMIEAAESEEAPQLCYTAKPAVIQPKQVIEGPAWPLLTPAAHDGLVGKITKFNANLQALELLKSLSGDAKTELNDEQRAILNRYTGWGGIKEPFDTGYLLKAEWKDRAELLKSLLSEEQWQSAKESTLSAHFTPLGVVQSVWTALQSAGFRGGRVLETSAGTGYMLGTMPTEVVEKSSVTAVEIDEISASILRHLYGARATVLNQPFEKVDFPEDYFDLVFTNVPFANMQVPCTRRKVYSNWSIHNYFIARIIDLLRPGGIAAVITSSSTLDSADTKVRNLLNRRAQLLGALRLPEKAFSQTAETEVVADLLIFRKREAGEIVASTDGDRWSETDWPKDSNGQNISNYHSCQVNRYFALHPEHVMGKWTERSGRYGRAVVPVLTDLAELPQRVLQALTGMLPPGTYQEPKEETRVIKFASTPLERELEPGAFVLTDDGLAKVSSIGVEPVKLNKDRTRRVLGMIEIRDLALKLVREQAKRDASETDLARLRSALSSSYDRYVAKHNHLRYKLNRWAMSSDPYWPLLLSLEVLDSETNTVKKAAIFTERTVYPTNVPTTAQTPADAALISHAELGMLDLEFMARLLGQNTETVLSELLANGDAYVDPVTQKVEIASVYLSGNVRQKLRVAQAAGADYQTNVQALSAALPPDLKPTQIDVLPGAIWIPEDDYRQFVVDLVLDHEKSHMTSTSVQYTASTGLWMVNVPSYVETLRSSWSTKGATFETLFGNLLNQKDTVVTIKDFEGNPQTDPVATAQAQLKQEEIKQRFLTWIWQDDARADRLARHYNETFNCWAAPKFDGSRLRLPGYSHALQLRDHQLSAIARGASGANVLFGHDVGAGKTLEMICTSMELRRLGMARKPMHVVPGQCLEDYCAEFLRAYPGARILMARETDFEKANRQEFVLRCATGNWDAVVISHRMFESISADPDVVESYVEDILAEMKAAAENRHDRAASRDLNRQIKDWEARLEKMKASWKKDRLVTFSQTGVDYLFIDEADVYKNLFRISSMKNIAGLSNSNSQRAFDVFLKCMQIQKLHGNRERGLCMATATFISNTMAEMHTFMRYLQPFTLQSLGLDKFDAWAAQFGRAVNSLEVSPDGSSFRMHKRFKQFTNMPELMGMFRQVADIKTKEMLNLPRPALVGGEHQVCVSEPSAAAKAFVEKLVKRAEAVRNRTVSPKEDNMLAITGDGRKAALDLRLIDPHLPFDPKGKVGMCVDRVFDIWQRTAFRKGSQIIFCDQGTPNGKGFNLYEDIRSRLVDKGIPRAEIAFIHEFPKARDKALLFAKVRAGSVRVIIGSTSLCGVGANMQTRLYAAHHLDCPWRPRDITQRDGRIERQGNIWEAVEIIRYITTGTFDAYSWQTITSKAQFIAQVMRGDAEVRTVEDAQMSALSFEEVKALACGNPLVREKATIDSEILALSLREKSHREQVWDAKRRLLALPREIAAAQAQAQNYRQFIHKIEQVSVPEKAGLIVNEKLYRERTQIEKIITLSIAQLREKEVARRVVIGTFNGLTITYHGFGERFQIEVYDEGRGEHHSIGNFARGSNVLERVMEFAATLGDLAEVSVKRIDFLSSSEESLKAKSQEIFAGYDRLEQLRARSNEIAVELGLLKNMDGTNGISEDTKVESDLAKAVAEALDGDSAEADDPDESEGYDEADLHLEAMAAESLPL